jgi:hypothetical protein
MAVYTGNGVNEFASKSIEGGQEAFGQLDGAWQRSQPLITAQQLKNQFLFGISLTSREVDPITGQVQVMTDELLDEYIDNAITDAEMELGIRIMPVQVEERYPWDRKEYLSMGYMKLRSRPIASIERVDIESSDGQLLYLVPNDWVETGYLEKGQLNIVPLTTIALQGLSTVQPTSNGAAAFLNLMATQPWTPGYWKVKYTVGFRDGLVPKFINQYIGIVAAIRVLAMLQATNAGNQSSSLGIDSVSQSKSTPGPNLYAVRIEQLEADRTKFAGKIKARFGVKLFSSNV